MYTMIFKILNPDVKITRGKSKTQNLMCFYSLEKKMKIENTRLDRKIVFIFDKRNLKWKIWK